MDAVQGEFVRRGNTDWAALCKHGREVTLIVFATAPERGYWELWKTFEGDGVRLASRHIERVKTKYIRDHCQLPASGLDLDHDGILDGFNGSLAHYYSRGEWLRLTCGA